MNVMFLGTGVQGSFYRHTQTNLYIAISLEFRQEWPGFNFDIV